MDRSRTSSQTPVCFAALTFFIIFLSTCLTSTHSYVFPAPPRAGSSKIRYSPVVNTGRRIHKSRDDGSAITLYLFRTATLSQSPPVDVENSPSPSRSFHASSRPFAHGGASLPSTRPKTQLPAMSKSVLATCDTLPSFSTAHGLLSPEVVMRIADNHDLEEDGPLHKFLTTYKSRGPMACLPMLADPSVLPELTRAMRDIA